MDALALRNHLEASGFRLSVVPDGLRVEPASALTTETRQLIRANRDALIGLVRLTSIKVASPDLETSRRCELVEPERPATNVVNRPPARVRRATDREAGQIFVGLKALWARTGEADSPEFPEALEIALANPGAALASLQADGVL